MEATTPQQVQPPSSRPGRKPKRSSERSELGQKPRKVNSEIRKQQNRIASRNYREKRKRKLQYLQQLLRDQPTDQEAAQSSETVQDARTRSLSAEYHAHTQAVQSSAFRPKSPFDALSATTSSVIDPVLATTASYDNHRLTTSRPFQHVEPSWDASIYEPPPQSHISSWNVPQWMPSIDFTPHLQAGPEDYQYAPPPTPQAFEQIPTTPQQPLTSSPNADLFILGSNCRRPVSEPQGISCVSSLRSLSPYNQAQYFRTP
ncbi:hypothetical protein CC78DRAFT_587455 [Lojkania enalia]|uniref:BZIP domain-containing protein n=1 Tax=Lojkania enalia TaxID=147567 RepID=A0A9P4JVZ3_9PLEO|nr:hypothetical protein CC78DRAFT_587455 [Didymosphaeria enalia]